MRALREFLKAWRMAKDQLRYIKEAEAQDAWTSADAGAALAFFNSETGRKLKARLDNSVFNAARVATRNPSNVKYHFGVARGVELSVANLEQHLNPNYAFTPPNEVDEENESRLVFQGEPDFLAT